MTRPGVDRFPLTAAQAGVWLGQQLNPGSAQYNAAECVEVLGRLDTSVFEKALRQTVSESDALHARFVRVARGVEQEIGPSADWSLPIIDVSGVAEPREAARRWMRADLETVVDLERGPLFAHALFVLGSESFLWYHRSHHIALDGYGFSLVACRVARLYNALLGGRPCGDPTFGALRTVVDDDLAYQSSTQREEDRQFWSAYFGDRPKVVSLVDRTSVPCGRLLRQSGRLPARTMGALRAVARQAGATWVEVVLALVATYVKQRTGAGEVILGVPVMGRLGSVASRVPAMIMNIVALRVPIAGAAKIEDVVRTVAGELRKSRPYHRYRGEHVRRDLKLLGDGRRLYGPLVNVMPFDYDLSFGGRRAVAENLSAGAELVEDIAIHVHARSDGEAPALDLDANPRCYKEAELATHRDNLVELMADPSRGVSPHDDLTVV